MPPRRRVRRQAQAAIRCPSDAHSDDDESRSTSAMDTDSSELSSLPSEEEDRNVSQFENFRVGMPTAVEISEAQRVIQSESIHYKAADKECKDLKQQLKSVEMRLQKADDELRKQRAYLSRFRAIPPEVLGIVFMFFIQDGIDSPWDLMHVNRAWRHTAIKTHALWGGIVLCSPAWQAPGRSRWVDGREMCGSTKLLRRALRRAHLASLDVIISTDYPRREISKKATRIAHNSIFEMISFLHDSGRFRQVVRLFIKGTNPKFLDPTVFEKLDFARLESLHVEHNYPDFVQRMVHPSSRHLHTLELKGAKNIAEEDWLSPELCPSIKHVKIEGFKYCHWNPDYSPLFIIAEHVTFLEIRKHHSRFVDGRKIHFPQLKNLILDEVESFWSITAPLLTSLTMADARISVNEEGYNLFPSLIHLSVVSYTVDGLNKIRAPNLQALHLHLRAGRYINEPQLHIFREKSVEPGYLNPVLFHLIETTIVIPSFLELLDSMNRLETLELERVPLKKSFFQALEPKEVLESEKSIHTGRERLKKVVRTPVPGIKAMKLDFAGCWASTRAKTTRAFAPKVMKKRAAADVLESASVRFTLEDGWVDLLQ